MKVRMQEPPVQKKGTARKIATAALAAAGATAGVLYLAKTGKLNPVEGGNKTVEAVKAFLKKPADKVLTSAKVMKFATTVADKYTAAKEGVSKCFSTAKAKFAELKQSNLVANADKKVDTIKDKLESVSNPTKFGKIKKINIKESFKKGIDTLKDKLESLRNSEKFGTLKKVIKK